MTEWLHFWKAFDRARIVPRLCLGFYTYQMWIAQQWFMALKDPSGAQAAFVSTVWGSFALLLNFYMQRGTDWTRVETPHKPEDDH